MVLPAPECSVCTRRNGLSIRSDGFVEYIIDENDPLYNQTCPEGYRCWDASGNSNNNLNLDLSSNDSGIGSISTTGCCVPCEQDHACPEGTIAGMNGIMSNICPDGYLCDPLPEKCSLGEICSRNQRISCTEENRYIVWLKTVGLGKVLDGTYCPAGSATIRNCPMGYYCPDAKSVLICPSGYFCPMKTARPEISCSRCPMGALQLYRNLHLLGGFFILIILAACFVTVLTSRFGSGGKKEGKSLSSSSEEEDKSDHHSAEGHESSKQLSQEKGVTFTYDSIVAERKGTKGDKVKVVLNNLSGTLRPNRICAILGESGAGKSTLLDLFSGQVPFFRDCRINGTVGINGMWMKASQWIGSSEAKKRVGYVSQNDVVYHELTVYENLFWSARFQMSGSVSSVKVKRRVHRIVDLLGLSSVQYSIVNRLSGGERRRVSIGVALMGEPQLLILDEPTSGLDASSSMSIMKILKKLASQDHLTVICSIHQPRHSIFSFMDDLILLSRGGNVVFDGRAEDAQPYFEGLGYQIPPGINPADFLVDVSTGDIPLAPKKVEDDVVGDLLGTCHRLANEWRKNSTTLHVTTLQVDHGAETQPIDDYDRGRVHQKGDIWTRPSPLIQFWYQLQRNVLLVKRNWRIIAVNTAVICSGSGLISFLQGPTIVTNEKHEYPISIDTFQSLQSMGNIESEFEKFFLFATLGPTNDLTYFAVKISLITGVLLALAAAKAISDKREVVFREIASGFSLSAYFLACSSLSIAEHGCQMLLAGVISYWIRVPLQTPLPYLVNFFMLHWGMVSWGHLLAILVPPENLTIIGGTIMLSGGLLCSGIATPIVMKDIYSSKAIAITAGLLSPARFFIEDYVVSDFRCLPEQYGFTTTSSIPVTVFNFLHLAIADGSVTKRSCNGWYYGSLRVFVIGLTLRTLTLVLIHFSYKRKKLSFRCKGYNRWNVVFLLCLFIALLTISIALIIDI